MKKRILFVVDKEGWAYDDAAKNWRERLKNEYQCDILYLNNYEVLNFDYKFILFLKNLQSNLLKNEILKLDDFLKESRFFVSKLGQPSPIFNHKNYDGLYFFYHRAVCDKRLLATPFPMEKVAVAINNEKWVENGAEKEFKMFMEGVRIVAGCNDFIIQNFLNIDINIYKVAQSINSKIFCNLNLDKNNKTFNIGWSGNYSNPIKNFKKIEEICNIDGVKLHAAKDFGRRDLNLWYNQMDMVICGSSSEGGPLMLLEAGATALPILTTKVGLAREIIKNDFNGLFIDIENQQDIEDKILGLKDNKNKRKKLSLNLYNEISKNWTYEARLFEIKNLLKELTNDN